jgi:O-antigen ligase
MKKTDHGAMKKIITAIPFVIMAAVIPLIIHYKVLPVEQAVQDFWIQSKQNADYFSYYKSILIIGIAALSLALLFIYPKSKNSISDRRSVIIPIAVYAVCIIISTAFSEYGHTALYGFPDRYEGALVLLSYLTALFLCMVYIKDEAQIKIILGSLAVSSVIIGGIGLLQVFGLDIFNTDFGKSLILSGEFKDYVGSIRVSHVVNDINAAVSTLYNSNVLGQYMSMIFPLAFVFFLMARSLKLRILNGALVCLIFANLIGSNSRAAFISVVLTSIILTIYLLKHLISKWKQLVAVFICFVLIFILIDYSRSGFTGSWMLSAFSVKDVHNEDVAIDKIKNFELRDSQLILECTNSKLTLDASNNLLRFLDEGGNELIPSSIEQDVEITLNDSRYKNYTFTINRNLIKIKKGKSFLYFAAMDGKFLLLDRGGAVVNDFNVDGYGFVGFERFASGRGYIWSRTIPLLPQTLIRGFGPDTFAMYFPQRDFIGKLNFMYDAYLLIDKPHNMYLQMAINTGVLSLVAFLFIITYYIAGTISALRHSRFDSFTEKARLAIFVAIIGYLISGMSTDSAVSTAPVFWVLLGLGISLRFATCSSNHK